MAWPKNYNQYDGPPGQGGPKEWRQAFNQRLSPEEAAEILAGEDQTPWQILGVSQEATEAEIKKHFRELIVVWHPDRAAITGKSKELCEKMTKKIIAAYSILTAKKKR